MQTYIICNFATEITNMKNLLFYILLGFLFQTTLAQNFSFKGTVLDETGYGLSYVTLKDTLSKKQFYTDQEGKFSVELPRGTYVFEIGTVGFTTKYELIKLNNNLTLDFSLEQEAFLLEEVVLKVNDVEEILNSVEMSTEVLDVEEIKKIPAFLGEPDILNAIKLLPGVTSVGEGASGFNVRGGNIDQNLILSDNASIYSSSHLFGFFSVFNPDAVKDLKLYKGGMPAKYGERVSSVLDVHQRSGSFDSLHIDGGIGLVSSRLTVGGPIIKDTLSFIVSGRRTYVDQFFKLSKNETLNTTSTYFYDLNAKIDYTPNVSNYLSFTGYYGRDVFDISNSSFRFDFGNAFGVLNWENTSKEYLKIKASVSNTDYNYTLGGADFFYWKSRISTITEKVNFEYNKIDKHLIGFGVQNNNHHFRPAKLTPTGELKDLFAGFELSHEWAAEQGVYVQDEFKLSEKMTLLGGLRYSLYNSFGRATEYIYQEGAPKEAETVIDSISFKKNQITKTYMGFEPRFSGLYKIDSVSSFKFSYNRNLQYMQLVSNTSSGLPLDVWKAADYHIKPLKVNQFAIGYVRGVFDNKIEFTSEVYYKLSRDVLDYKNNADLFLNKSLETELLAGKGRAYGLELMLRKKKGDFTGWMSYTLSRAELLVQSNNKSETINNGQWYKASYHKPHDFSFVCSYQWTKRFSTSLNAVYATGRAITLPDGKYEIYGVVLPSYSARNQSRLSDYKRVDLSAELQNKHNGTRKWNSYWSFSIYNVFSRRNAYSYSFQSTPDFQGKVERLSILGSVFPSATYNFKF